MNRASHKKAAQKVFLHEMSWLEVKALIDRKPVVIIPTGSIEQHGPHLPIGTDSYIGWELCKRVAENLSGKVPFVLAPPVVFGASSHHLDFPGTLSINTATYVEVIVDICESFVHHGFAKILLLNSHGGNISPLDIAIRTIRDRHQVLIAAATYWVVARDQIASTRDSDVGGIAHAGELETSCILAIYPHLVKKDLIEKKTAHWRTKYIVLDFQDAGRVNLAQHMRDFTTTGVSGDPTVASKEKGERFFAEIAGALSQLIREFSTWDLGMMSE